jgi:hypothetical protein
MPVTISIERGPHWTHVAPAGPVRFNVLPQIVLWVEGSDGTLVDTLYVTGALGGRMTHAGKKRKGTLFWQECCPAWSKRVLDAGRPLPSYEAPYPDSVTSATPHSSFVVRTKLPAGCESFTVYAEVNKSGDYNDVFTKERTDWIGQPSIVYSAAVASAKPGTACLLKPVGFGDASAVQQINSDLAGIDTALDIVREIKIEF